MKMRKLAALAALPTLFLASNALALRPTDVAAERPLETAAGDSGRTDTPVRWNALPAKAAASAWQRFVAAHGTWESLWDDQTGVPMRLWGAGIAVPGASASADIAEKAAWRMLVEHLDLLAPGAGLADFQRVGNTVHGRGGTMRTVGFAQFHQGMKVVGGSISFLFKHDRLFVISSDALPHVTAALPAAAAASVVMQDRAAGWIASLYGARPTVGQPGERVILPILRDAKAGGGIEYRVVRVVDAASTSPVGRWDVYVDAATGAPVARTQKLFFGSGTVKYKVPKRRPGVELTDYPAILTTLSANGASATTSDAGVVTWSGNGAATIATGGNAGGGGFFGLVGPRARTFNQSGAVATASLNLANNGTAVWDPGTSEFAGAQLTAFIHINIVKAYAKANLNPTLPFLDQQLKLFVNEGDHCNAFSNGGDEVHFFSAGSVDTGGGQMLNCENTGRIADVMYHEFGHSLHGRSRVPGAPGIDGAMGEGLADYLAATITDDHGMGRGFFPGDGNPLRDLDPPRDLVYPDDLHGEVHDDGEIVGGTTWDMRAALIQQLGQAEGVRHSDDLYYAILQRAGRMTTMFTEALAADDDDGNLNNGTPNKCLLQGVFARHGLAPASSGTPSATTPERDGLQVHVGVTTPAGDCPVSATSTLTWRVRGSTATSDVAMTMQGNGFTGAIPTQPDGTVVQYQVAVTFSTGQTFRFPDNRADPFYEMYVGPVENIYCTDFEQDPADWTHSAMAGTDEWAWGTPAGTGGDPTAAASGTHVFGIDLGGGGGRNGQYEASSDSGATTPEVDVHGFTAVRLQYKRWLGIEDGFFDHATIEVDGAADPAWSSFASPPGTPDNQANVHHIDKEWRFQDVDLTPYAADGKVKVTFHLDGDAGLQFGGWTLDDVCIVGVRAPTGTECGNGEVESGEQCDDGNTAAGDGCSPTCQNEPPPPGCGDGTVGNGEECDDGNTTNGDGCSAACTEEDMPPMPPGTGDPEGGCCSTGNGNAGSGIALALVTGLVLVRRRRRR